MSHVMIIVSPYYKKVTDMLLDGAVTYLREHGMTYDTCEVSGALEIPFAAKAASYKKSYDGAIALGCVIRGETTHYDIVAFESARAIMDLTIAECLALGNGIQTVENEAQALARARKEELNKGGHAASAVLDMIKLRDQFIA